MQQLVERAQAGGELRAFGRARQLPKRTYTIDELRLNKWARAAQGQGGAPRAAPLWRLPWVCHPSAGPRGRASGPRRCTSVWRPQHARRDALRSPVITFEIDHRTHDTLPPSRHTPPARRAIPQIPSRIEPEKLLAPRDESLGRVRNTLQVCTHARMRVPAAVLAQAAACALCQRCACPRDHAAGWRAGVCVHIWKRCPSPRRRAPGAAPNRPAPAQTYPPPGPPAHPAQAAAAAGLAALAVTSGLDLGRVVGVLAPATFLLFADQVANAGGGEALLVDTAGRLLDSK